MAESAAGVRELESDRVGGVTALPSAPAKPRSKARKVFVVMVAVAALGGGLHFALSYGRESTDNAQVAGHVVSLAPRVAGVVQQVLVREHDSVQAGQLLVQLDVEQLDARLADARAQLKAAQAIRASAQSDVVITERAMNAELQRARAELARAELAVRASRSGLAREQADLLASGSQEKLAVDDLKRAQELLESGAASLAALDGRQAAREGAAAAVARARAQSEGARNTVGISRAAVDVAAAQLSHAETAPERIAAARAAFDLATARVEQSEVAVKLAELNRSYAELRAPCAGSVSRLEAEVGQMSEPNRPLLALVRSDDMWVVANFKETQIARMRAGMPARLEVDAYPARDLRGHVQAIGGAVGSLFSLLPPDNSAGNYVKVVQRVPVAIGLESRPDPSLFPGMSVTVTVDTRTER